MIRLKIFISALLIEDISYLFLFFESRMVFLSLLRAEQQTIRICYEYFPPKVWILMFVINQHFYKSLFWDVAHYCYFGLYETTVSSKQTFQVSKSTFPKHSLTPPYIGYCKGCYIGLGFFLKLLLYGVFNMLF